MDRIYLTFLLGLGGAIFSNVIDYFEPSTQQEEVMLIGGEVEEAKLGQCEHTLIEMKDDVVSLHCAR